MRLILVAILLAGCSSESSTTTPPGSTDSGSDASDASTDSALTDTATSADATNDSAIACPSTPPMNGDPCARPSQKCDYPTDCGPMAGDYATCTAGGWSVIKRPCTAGDTGTD